MPRRRKQWLRPTETELLTQLPVESAKLILEGAMMPMTEIAQIRGWPVGTVKSKLSRARAKLSKLREAASAKSQQQ